MRGLFESPSGLKALVDSQRTIANTIGKTVIPAKSCMLQVGLSLRGCGFPRIEKPLITHSYTKRPENPSLLKNLWSALCSNSATSLPV